MRNSTGAARECTVQSNPAKTTRPEVAEWNAKSSPAAREGYEAGQKGDPTPNPYPEGSMDHVMWEYGQNLGLVMTRDADVCT